MGFRRQSEKCQEVTTLVSLRYKHLVWDSYKQISVYISILPLYGSVQKSFKTIKYFSSVFADNTAHTARLISM